MLARIPGILLCLLLPLLLGGVQAQHRAILMMGGATSGDVTTPCVVADLSRTSITTFDVTCSGFGTPKAAVALWTGVTSGNTQHATLLENSIGFTDGTNQFATSYLATSGSPTQTGRRRVTDEMFVDMFTSTGVVDGEANFSAWTTNGITYNQADAVGTATRFHTVLFGGADFTAVVGNLTANATSGGTAAVTGLGFQPEIILFISAYTASNDAFVDDIQNCFGVAVRGIGQGSVGFFSDDGLTTSDSSVLVEDRYACVHNDGINPLHAIEVTAWGSDGFTVTSRIGSVSNVVYGYMAINLVNKTTFFKVIDLPNATGTATFSGLGSVTPDFASILAGSATATRTVQTGNTHAMSAAMAFFSSATAGNIAGNHRDAVTSMAANSHFNTNAIAMDDGAGAQSHVATFVDASSGQYRLSFSVATVVYKAITWGWGN